MTYSSYTLTGENSVKANETYNVNGKLRSDKDSISSFIEFYDQIQEH